MPQVWIVQNMGKTLEDAVNIAEELEETAKLFFLLRGIPDVRYLSDAQVQELLPAARRR